MGSRFVSSSTSLSILPLDSSLLCKLGDLGISQPKVFGNLCNKHLRAERKSNLEIKFVTSVRGKNKKLHFKAEVSPYLETMEF